MKEGVEEITPRELLREGVLFLIFQIKSAIRTLIGMFGREKDAETLASVLGRAERVVEGPFDEQEAVEVLKEGKGLLRRMFTSKDQQGVVRPPVERV